MDQTNPLAEVTHKRRISALGPGGLSRERAGFEVRDVHYTHYGRLCTIETPEGPNIGLISSLCVYAKINNLGFIETPYRRVVNGRVMLDEEPTYYTAELEENKTVAQATTPQDEQGNIIAQRIKARRQADFPIVSPEEIDLIDMGSNQIASIAASLIPFLEHDDANRALMGSNMMRQAVPLLNPEIPIVGTGIEKSVAEDSRVLLNAQGDGVVEYVDSTKIVIRHNRTENERLVSFDEDVREYKLTRYQRTNHSTSINLRPIVKKGDKVKKGQVLCEGYATQGGELALGRNMMVAFMPKTLLLSPSALYVKISLPRFMSRNTHLKSAKPSVASRSSLATSPMSAMMPPRTSTKTVSSVLVPKSRKATSLLVKSPPRVSPIPLRKRNCSAPSSVTRPAM